MKVSSAILFFLLMAGFASAIVVDDYNIATNPPTGDYDVDWAYVYKYKNSSSVAVGEHWLLTAAHVGNDGGTGTVIVDGVSYYQQEVIFHDTADLALVRFDKAFPGYYPLYDGEIYTGSFFRKKYYELVMMGFGFDGVASSSSFTQGSSRGIKRWGTNKGGQETTISADIVGNDGVADVETKCFQMDFDLNDTSYEAGANIYDSGGPVFIDTGSEWALTGIILYRAGNDPYTGNSAAMIPDYRSWITQTMNAVSGDDDSDGIPNWWEEQYGTNIVSNADQDGDGFTGEEEWIADTDPTDSNSFWQVEGEITEAEQTFTFDGSTARKYQLQFTTNSLAATNLTWTAHGSPVWGEGANAEIAITNTANMAFYRVQTFLP